MATEDAVASRDSLWARTASNDPDDPRSRPQRMADLAVEDLTGAPPLIVAEGRWVGPRPAGEQDEATDTASAPNTRCTCRGTKARDRRVEIGVLIPLDVLAGLREGHATIDGEPVPAEVARGLFQSDAAVMRRMLTDPVTGHLLDLSPQVYRPGQQLKRFVRTRDQACWWPGCHRRARVCDEDHKQPFPDGPTIRANLGALCEHHHQLKHSGQWQIRVCDDGTVDLTGPEGATRHIAYPRLHDEPVTWDPPPTPDDDPPAGRTDGPVVTPPGDEPPPF